MLAAWGDTTEDDEASEEEDAIVALMDRNELNSDDELLDNLAQLKEKVCGLNKANLRNCYSLWWMNVILLMLKIAC